MNKEEHLNELNSIAIIGMAGRFPKSKSVQQLWENICRGRNCITFYTEKELKDAFVEPSLLIDSNYVKAKGELEDIDMFDASFFGVNLKEAELMDPQHRFLLECAWEALEDAGYDPKRYDGRIGVYAGEAMNTYLLLNVYPKLKAKIASIRTLQAAIGNDKDSLTTTISYKLNLRGPGITIQSSSSTSLVAICIASQGLLNYQCDIALAGGVAIVPFMKSGYLYEEGGILSPDGYCRAFDKRSNGFVPGYGMGLVVLKRLSDALEDQDNIYAVIRGWGVNNDGSNKVSYSAPSVNAQAEVILEAHAMAGIDVETIKYIEAHGTGTHLGDPIEVAALTQAFHVNTKKKKFCALGSIKTNIGHLDTAAGVTGLIKAALCVKHGLIPPSLYYEEPNPNIDFENSPFYVNTMLAEWNEDEYPRRAGVTSLGMGGTNAHVVLEEPPNDKKAEKKEVVKLLVLSAKTERALNTMTSNLKTFLRENSTIDIDNVAYTLQVGRGEFNQRRFIIYESLDDAIDCLNSES